LISETKSAGSFPPPTKRAPYTVAVDGMRLELGYRQPVWRAIFVTVWLIGWGAGSLLFTAHLIANPTLRMAFAISLLWCAWVVQALLLMTTWLRRENLVLDREGLFVEQTSPVSRVERRIPLWELRRFDCVPLIFGLCGYAIEARSIGMPLRFANALTWWKQGDWLARRLNEHLAALLVDPRPVMPLDLRPSDCRWELIEETACLVFISRGRFSLSWLAVQPLVLIVCYFFVALPALVFWEMLKQARIQPGYGPSAICVATFVGLLFFGGIGIVGAFQSLLEPVRRRTCQIRNGVITFSSGWDPVRWRQCYVNDGALGIQVEDAGDNPLRFGPGDAPVYRPNDYVDEITVQKCRLVFLSADGKPLCALKRLTHGEARWMAHVLVTRWPNQFVPISTEPPPTGTHAEVGRAHAT